MDILIKGGANVNIATKVRYIHIMHAHIYIIHVRTCTLRCYMVFIITTQDGETPLIAASMNGKSAIVKLLVKNGANINVAMSVSLYMKVMMSMHSNPCGC